MSDSVASQPLRVGRTRSRDIARKDLNAHVFGMFKEVEMRKHPVLVLTATLAFFTCGAIAASAQAPVAPTTGTQQGSTTQPAPGGPMDGQDQTGLQRRAQAGEREDSDQDNFFRYHRGMMGGGLMGPGMMAGRMAGGMNYGSRIQGHDTFGPMMMRMMFSLMDADGDGKLSLQEFQAAHERIFKAMDANKDGFVTLEEMQNFMRGTSRPAAQ
jgi:EF hand